jgi:hypothetical protein
MLAGIPHCQVTSAVFCRDTTAARRQESSALAALGARRPARDDDGRLREDGTLARAVIAAEGKKCTARDSAPSYSSKVTARNYNL